MLNLTIFTLRLLIHQKIDKYTNNPNNLVLETSKMILDKEVGLKKNYLKKTNKPNNLKFFKDHLLLSAT